MQDPTKKRALKAFKGNVALKYCQESKKLIIFSLSYIFREVKCKRIFKHNYLTFIAE
jgi:hypothetical protein